MHTGPSVAIVGQAADVTERWSESARMLGFSVETFSDSAIWRVASLGRTTCAVVDVEIACERNSSAAVILTDQAIPLIVIADCLAADDVLETVHRGAVAVVPRDSDPAQRAAALGQATLASYERAEHRRLCARVAAAQARLTSRERQVLEWVMQGQPNKWIASRLGLSVRTIESDRQRTYNAFGINTVAELVTLVIRAEGSPKRGEVALANAG